MEGRSLLHLLTLVYVFVSANGAVDTQEEAGDGDEVLVYVGNGCFWGRQKDFVDMERQDLGRSDEEVTAITGYAGGHTARGLPVCYYSGRADTHYDRLGHAEVTQIALVGGGAERSTQMRLLAKRYFSQFNKARGGMERLDPQDKGLGYRNVVGVPGGVAGPLFHDFASMNLNNMVLVEGEGGEPDTLNTVFVMDSEQFPFFQAEMYHQFHHGLGHQFDREYTYDLRLKQARAGRVKRTACPERGISDIDMADL
mmetsp:Transcript_10091/g.17331  ORF Transcript_10091/g.17331 Transcript_10091/m.17331 type:complete len:254 (-) Transcript_10091:810-1571(-)|eukprot:CAMPEP_0198222712 /NCGR_PEP_ID=MMETSP1445-20131203/89311_1 /TAXON_ID=36898 /ORGANISM="Pyramimonas sp., Strain CCMP2087" /LENGTH=253 /DNA_ID=CAMNT_0043901315 /DNA_START=80 /DNA_END=841 /DNA_ORIENTATION=-